MLTLGLAEGGVREEGDELVVDSAVYPLRFALGLYPSASRFVGCVSVLTELPLIDGMGGSSTRIRFLLDSSWCEDRVGRLAARRLATLRGFAAMFFGHDGGRRSRNRG